MPLPTISKITLPSGNTYEIKDSYARQLIAGGLNFVVCWDGSSVPDVTKIPAGVKVKYNDVEYVGTFAASDGAALTFYLIKSSTQESENDYYDEYVVVTIDERKSWEKLGDTRLNLDDLGELAYRDRVVLRKGNGADVLGANATFLASDSQVSFADGSGSDFVTGYNNDGVPPSFSEGEFDAGSLPTLGDARKQKFAVEGLVAAMGSGNDDETLILSMASKSDAVTEQGVFDAGSLPSKVADTFNAGSAASLATAKALTAASTGTAAAQTISINNADTKKATLHEDLSVSVE